LIPVSIKILRMNYPAASNGVSIGILIIAPKGGEVNLHSPLEALPASEGVVRRRIIVIVRNMFRLERDIVLSINDDWFSRKDAKPQRKF